LLGHFEFENPLRTNVEETLNSLSSYDLTLLSGDNEGEKERMENLFPNGTKFLFNQNPKDKLNYIRHLQQNDRRIMMIGDGLNDAGALRQSDVGIVITEDNNNFSPACDVIISSDNFPFFTSFISYIKNLRFALYGAFVLALFYNLIGLGFAVTGNLSPVVAAILMPASSISIMIYGLLVSKILARKIEKYQVPDLEIKP
jgi:Cu+-exporting ATPase